MALSFGPFAGSGPGSSISEDFWIKMARLWLSTGVVRGEQNELATFADSTGMQVKVPAGSAWIEGQLVINDALAVLAVGAANASNPRIDRVVMRKDTTAKTFALLVTAGTPASSPVAPALTRTATVYDLALAQVLVPAAATTIASANVTDQRSFTRNLDLESVQAAANKTFANTILNGTVGGTAVGGGANQVAPGVHAHGFSGLTAQALLGFYPGTTVAYAYSGGLLASETFTGSSQLAGWSRTYTYDGSGRVQTVTLKQGATTVNTTTYTYNGDGTVATEVHA